ncbi:MAG TPA: DinB family protein [Terriglobales bacterium]|nr:DinB family protein [Terriglobales bacterium]
MVPNFAYIQELFIYNDWANDRMLGAVATIPPEQLKRNLGNSFGSVHDTLAHIVGAEWIWLERWLRRSPVKLPCGSDFNNLEAITDELREVRSNRNRWLGKVSADVLAENVSYCNLRGQSCAYPLWQQLTHVVNHSTYHRGQVVTLLRQLGQKGFSTDFLLFYDERNERSAAQAQR